MSVSIIIYTYIDTNETGTCSQVEAQKVNEASSGLHSSSRGVTAAECQGTVACHNPCNMVCQFCAGILKFAGTCMCRYPQGC